MLVITALGRLRKEYCQFQANLSYIARPCWEKKEGRKEGRKEGVREGGKTFIECLFLSL
jgi:hypothetical protein